MKKVQLTLLAFLFTAVSFASNLDAFQLDYNAVQDQFTELNQIAQKVKTENLTYDALASTDAALVNQLALSSAVSVPLPEGALGIPSFLWGCVLGPIGVLIDYLMTDNDTDEAKKALWGCLAVTVVEIIVYFAFFAAAAGAASSAGAY